ncbi:MAG: hypothetical protein HRT58_22410 [Crocinitomicaceae bacterium]|nr:hypothetical protein [Flavobacteriales bacterium]NQZ38431.1 hypothetical protein [Crocinitomicaceae bacterium]
MQINFNGVTTNVIISMIIVGIFSAMFLGSSVLILCPVLIVIFYFYFRKNVYSISFEDKGVNIVFHLRFKNRTEFRDYADLGKIIIDYSPKFGGKSEDFIQITLRENKVLRVPLAQTIEYYEKIAQLLSNEVANNNIVLKIPEDKLTRIKEIQFKK